MTDAQCALVGRLTEDAVRGEVGDRLTDPPQPGVASVALSMAARVLTNPTGISSEQAGGMLMSYFASQIGQAMSDDERRRLRRAVGIASGAGMLDISPPTECAQGDLRMVW
ncbi:hypothetical protein [Streptomyces sparsogenes]|uniref:hypothetical protein n=1 Tax=Streptomyces sparsogenes TaxID=67365 RepID=UPI0033D2FE60